MLQEQLSAYLSQKLAADGVSVSGLYRIPGGASRETWAFDAAWQEDGKQLTQGFILRRDPDASLLETERDLEYHVMRAAGEAGLPVPRMFWLEPDGAALDRPFFIMERIDGCETSPQKVIMDPRFFPARGRIAEQYTSVLAGIHKLDVSRLPRDVLGEPPAPEACALREIERWEGIVDRDSLEPEPVLRAAFRWLRRNLPAPPSRVGLVHGDYRTGNFLCSPEGEIKGVLDWEMTHLGDPMEDIAWACLRPWRWLGNEQVGGLMERHDFYEKYSQASGISVDEQAVHFWEVHGNVKLAAIFHTGGRSFCEGRTRSPMMAMLSRNTRRLQLEVLELMGV